MVGAILLCLLISESACGAEKDDTPYEYSAFDVTLNAGFQWANGSKLLNTGFGPDALFLEGAGDGKRQVETGRCVFVVDVTPLEFAGWLCPARGTEVVLSAGGEGPSFDQRLIHCLWIDTGLTEHNVGRIQVTGIRLSGEGWEKSWAEAKDSGEPIKIGNGNAEAVHFRLRLDLNDEERKRIFKQGDTGRLQFVVGIDIGKIPGNEELARALANRKGSTKELYMSTVAFTLVKKGRETQDPRVAAALANWRIRKARLDPKAQWSSYEELLKIQPVNETALLAYAKSLEKGEEPARAVKVFERLIKAIEMRPDSTHRLFGITTILPYDELTPMEPKELIAELKRRIALLRKQIAQKP